MREDRRVQILLSTYNGARFLQEQLDSFLEMNGFDQCCVLIRDDGSTDETRDILHRYENRKDFQVVYGENIGITNSYLWLLEHCDPHCDYFAFSDQDDIWLPDKMEKAMAALEASDQETPTVFASLSLIVNEDLQNLGCSTLVVRGVTYYNAMIQNVLPGHTQVINVALCRLLIQRGMDDVHVLDWWVYLAASAVGQVIFYPEVTVLHRQHADNAVGYAIGFSKNTIRRMKYLFQGRGNAFARQLRAFYSRYKDILPESYKKETAFFLGHCTGSFQDRLSYAVRCHTYRQSRQDTLIFRILYALGKYSL